MKRAFYILFITLFSFSKHYAQDPQFSQFYSNPLYLGPSFAGAVEGSRIAATYRNQWWDINVPFYAYSFSYDHYFSTFNSGLGIQAVKDVAGTSSLGSMNIGVMYSYNFQVFNVWHVRPGISFHYLQHGLDGDLLFLDQIIHASATSTSAPIQTRDYARDIDAGASLIVYTVKFWSGFTVDHMLTPNITLYATEATVPVKISIYGGYEFARRGKLLKPSDETMTFAFMYKQQARVKQLDLGVYWHKYPLVLGLWYRGIPIINSHRGDAIVFLAGIKTRQFNIGYSYDFTISNLLLETRGSHEISTSFKFLLPRRTKLGRVPCPEF